MDRLERSERAAGECLAEADKDRASCSLEEWRLLGRPSGLDLHLQGDDDVTGDLDAIVAANRITIEFPAFTDGRGFSLGRRLRQHGYGGEMIADGQLLPDQWALLERCGFSALASAELHARAESCLRPTRSYQSDAQHPTPLFRRRHAAEGN
jgi:uncharacterized protein (DUF934 family)